MKRTVLLFTLLLACTQPNLNCAEIKPIITYAVTKSVGGPFGFNQVKYLRNINENGNPHYDLVCEGRGFSKCRIPKPNLTNVYSELESLIATILEEMVEECDYQVLNNVITGELTKKINVKQREKKTKHYIIVKMNWLPDMTGANTQIFIAVYNSNDFTN